MNSSNKPVVGRTSRYTPFGSWRTEPTANLTDRGYTGHMHHNLGSGAEDIGLVYMAARWYAPALGRFISADTLIPNPANPQSYNRYSYVGNRVLNATDPTGHRECDLEFGDCNKPMWRNWSQRRLKDILPAGIEFGEPLFNGLPIEGATMFQPFGPNSFAQINGGLYTNSSRMHPGLDFIKEYDPTCYDNSSCEMDVHANITMSGIVVDSFSGDAGPNVVIRLDNGLYIIYGHVDPLVYAGEVVNPGDLIGRLHNQRNTPRADGSMYDNTHLHLAVRIGERTINPLYFFKPEDIHELEWQSMADGETIFSVSSYRYSTTSYWQYPSSPRIDATRY